MAERWSRRTLLALAGAGLVGCTGRTTESVEPRSFPDAYYQGPLVSAHEHMNGGDGSARDSETLSRYSRWMERNGVDRVMAITPPYIFSEVKPHSDSLIPFLFGYPFINQHRSEFATRIKRTFRENDFLRGIGELGVYQHTDADGMPLAPDVPQMLELYDFAADQDVPIMVHGAAPWHFPDSERQSWDSPLDCPTLDQMENAYEHNRDTQFLVHGTYFSTGEMTIGEMAAQALEAHPNLYYDISALKPYGVIGLDGESMTQEKFERKMEETGVEHHAAEHYEKYKPVLEGYSDRVLWGMDAALEWNYAEWALDTWIDVARSLLGRLSTEDARNVGYRTAQELFDLDDVEEFNPS